ncbi:MAG TPA: Stp1/IreP family PP2C-type Ser/Thr phosphatase [Acidimicrobiia bacterium]|nr:Stp1/IreP family PP2C-type Ser/Thr phosphatase [Acidimicrobiia bacterium]
MKLKVGVATDVGRTRTANEDSFLRDDKGQTFAVADGMGGHRAGDVASATAVDVVTRELAGGATLVEAIVAANDEVFAKAQANPEMRGMGTTVTSVLFDGERALLAHVGDSRGYLWRDRALTQVTEDHSLVEELVRQGRLTPEEAAVHPQRNIVTRALGVDADVLVDTYEIDLYPGDRLLLCSDGLSSMMRDDEIAAVLRGDADPQAAADALVDAANRAGGEDNITVLVIDVVGDRGKARQKAVAAGADAEPPAAEKTGEWDPVDAPETGDTPALAQPPGTGAGAKAKAKAAPRARRPLRRALLWGLPFVVVIGVALFTLRWYARSTYHLGTDAKRDVVVLYRGVPDGFLVWDPTVEERTEVRVADLTEADANDVRSEKRFSSESSARRYVNRLAESTSTTTSPTTTTTSQPAASAPTTAPA